MRRFHSCMTLIGTLSGFLVISSLFSPVVFFSAVTAHAEEGAQVVAEDESLDAEMDDMDELSAESLAGVDDSVAESPEKTESEVPDEGKGAILGSGEHQDGPPNPKHMWSPENMDGESGIVSLASGPYWTTNNGKKAFYDGYGALYASPALKVIDVSEWQGSDINWDAVAADGVDAAILRIGWGVGSEDRYFARNLSEVRRMGMPYGVYLYSYAYDANFAREEANSTADLLDKYNCKDLSLPIYYDIEKFNTWEGHVAPSSPKAYEEIVRTYIDTMAARGYTNVHVYTYRSYLQNELNSTYIRQRTSWIAEYGSRLNVTNSDYSGQYGWQYTDADRVNGISGNVDMNLG